MIPRVSKRYIIPDAIAIVASLYLSVWVRLGSDDPSYFALMTKFVPVFLFLKLTIFIVTGLYGILWRYVSVQDTLKIFRSVGLSTALMISTTYLMSLGRIPRSVFFIDALFTLILVAGMRFVWRLYHEELYKRELKQRGRRTLIIGAGSNGRTILTRFQTDVGLGLSVVGFLDDDPKKIGMKVGGVKILGAIKDLATFLRHHRIEELIIAMPHAPGEVLTEILQTARKFHMRPRMMTALDSEKVKKGTVSLLRSVELGDLLRRQPRMIENPEIRNLIKGKRVLITGAGGSIGSEISRQVVALGPAQVLLLDHSEFNLYQIDKELGPTNEPGVVVPLLADLKDHDMLTAIFNEYAPEIIFHAAAYKHVHLVEVNPLAAILNNVLGLKNLLDLSQRANVQSFVLISTDKAVNPAGVMGATKRVCELLVTEAGKRTSTRYCAVRFGNVLGSSGSLIPLLTQQIQNGEPVTITHPEMTRYFMLIPEAVSLVLNAATIAKPGDITLLKMGEPVRILDVAKSLIALMGKSEEDVPIVFTGTRPGEKLFEELYLCGDEIETSDPDILIVPSGDRTTALRNESVSVQVDEMIELARSGDRDAVIRLNEIVRSGLRAAELISAAKAAKETQQPSYH